MTSPALRGAGQCCRMTAVWVGWRRVAEAGVRNVAHM